MSDEVLINPNLNNGREHRVGADLYDWEYNNTYDINEIVPDVKTFVDQLYTHSLSAQSDLCDIHRMCGSMSDFRRDVEINRQLGIPYYSYTLEIPIKNIRCFKNLALRRANPRIYTIHDSCQMTDMFKSRVMMFIDGDYYPAVKFYASSDRFILIIEVNNGDLSLNRMNNWIRSGATWSLLTLPFSTVKYKYGLTSNIVKGDFIPLTVLDKVSNAMYVKRNMWIVSVGTLSNEKSVALSTLATSITAEDGTVGLKLPKDFADTITSTYVTVEATAIPNIKGGLLLGTGRSFQIDLDTNPIPPQNIICWETDNTGSFIQYIHNAKITLHYPNVYVVETDDPTENIYVTWCYSDEDTTHFYNPLDEYMQYNASYAADIINDNLPKAIRTYVPYKSEYIEPNYLDYFDQATRRNDLTFKFETLKDLIADDTRRLERIYVDNVIRTEYKWHSNPRFTIKASEWGSFESRIRRNNSKEVELCSVEDFGTECIYFTMDHEDERSYPVAVWINGLRCMKIWQYTEKFRSFIYIPRDLIDSNSIIEIEVMKTRDDSTTVAMLNLGDKHNSVLVPDDFVDLSPQNTLVAVQEDTSDVEEDGSLQHIYKVAPNYEMYWLLIGNIGYVNGVPMTYSDEAAEGLGKTTVISTQDNGLLDENGNAITAGTGNLWTGGSTHYLAERGRKPSYIQVPDEQFPEDYNDLVKVRALGYYNDERRRFYEYMPNGEDDAPIYITPITNYFANKTVKIINTDIQKTWNFKITADNRQIKIRDFNLDPTTDKFRVYLNGRLLDAHHDYLIDASLPNGFYLGSTVTFAITAQFIGAADVLIEYVPYRYQLLYRLTNVSTNNIELRPSSIKRPFSLVYYDVYLNGRKLYAEDIIIKSPCRIIINTPVIGGTLSFYERAHDPDIYENDKEMRKALIDKIAEQDNNFRKWLLPNLVDESSGGIATIPLGKSVSCGNECVSGCISGCSNLCGTACSGACTTGCVGNCTGSCANEASSNACEGCSAGCSSSCYGCTNTCAANCGAQSDSYAGACSGCDGLCNDNCAASAAATTHISCAGCGASCGETCTSTCVGTVNSNSNTHTSMSYACASCASSCLSTCTGDCSGTVTSAACSGCAGTCINTCGGCSGNCTGSSTGHIETACQSCSASCSTACSENCGTSCATSCIGNCIGCAGTCDNQCVEGCLSGCTGGCESNCSSASMATTCASCNGSCSTTSTSATVMCAGCYTACSTTCGITCGIGCGSSCANASSSTGMSASCNTTCSSSCDITCTGTCSEACMGACKGTCSGDCDSSCVGSASSESSYVNQIRLPACSACDTSCSVVCGTTCTGTATAPTMGCNGCDTTCYTQCSATCKNDCEGVCASNSCMATCGSTCSGCSSVASAEASTSCSGCSSQCTGCSTTCTTNCGTGCSGGCTGCTGTCMTNCDTGCKLECTSCSSTCFGSCTDGCGTACTSSSSSVSGTDCSGCDATCATNCEGLCSTTCSSGCSTTCSATCGNACGTSCSGDCSSGCYGTCETSCSTECTTSCSATCTGCGISCSDGCMGSCTGSLESIAISCTACDTTCTTGCSVTCVSQCQNSCRENCSNNCSDECSNICEANCVGNCSTTCTTGCVSTCQETCTGNCASGCSTTCTGSSVSAANVGSCSGCSSSCAGMSSGLHVENNIRNIRYGKSYS